MLKQAGGCPLGQCGTISHGPHRDRAAGDSWFSPLRALLQAADVYVDLDSHITVTMHRTDQDTTERLTCGRFCTDGVLVESDGRRARVQFNVCIRTNTRKSIRKTTCRWLADAIRAGSRHGCRYARLSLHERCGQHPIDPSESTILLRWMCYSLRLGSLVGVGWRSGRPGG